MYTDSPSLRPKKLIAKGQIKRVSTRKEMEHGGKKERGEKKNLSEAHEEDGVRVEISSLSTPSASLPLLLERY